MMQAPERAAALGSVERLALAWMERDELPRIVIGPEMKLIWANSAAERDLERRKDVELRGGHFVTTDPSRQMALVDFVQTCGSAFSNWCLPCEDGDGHIVIRAQEILHEGGERAFGLIFHRTGSDCQIRYARLEQVFHLTPAEHRVLLRMLDGRTAEEAAGDLGISIETARSHIRQIYAKLGVRSREGMFRRIRPYRI